MAALTRPAARRFAVALVILSPAAPAQTALAGDAPSASPPIFHASPAVERWRPYIAEAAQRFAVPQDWIAAVMQAESAGLTHWNGRSITSHAGAMGLMQVMPGTYATMRFLHHLGADPYDPHDNIIAGAAYLRAMYDRFGYPGLFAAYNAGPARYADHLATGKPLAGETRDYIAQLARTPATPSMPPAILSGTRLFFPLGSVEKTARSGSDAASGDTDSAPERPASGGLFVPLAVPRAEER